jgi:superfamily II DNA/RNA helicase
MKPKKKSQKALKVTQSQAKMFEYSVPPEAHIELKGDPAELFSLTIGMLGDAAARINRTEVSPDDESKNLQFSARFFNAYLEGKFGDDTDAYLLLMASASFYLSNVPGSSFVLANKISSEIPDLEGDGLERLLQWLLLGARGEFTHIAEGIFTKNISDCVTTLAGYYAGEVEHEKCEASASALRTAGYTLGSPRHLLFADICAALINLRIQNSARRCLPLYSKLPLNKWENALKKRGFLQELWPSQHLLGEKGVYNGASAIVQMPTSAGKTRATELVIRSALIAKRTSLAVIVAPFRALCHEISDAFKEAFRGENISVDELTDVLQPDFDFDFLLTENFEILEQKRILVVTPEKLLYVLRHTPELADSIGLIIYDEGHQFDSGTRGVTYELLLTSLKRRIPQGAQTVLISAVISNAEAIGSWLLGENPTIAAGLNLSPMQRRVAFTGWSTTLGQLHFMEEDSLETEDFFVPRTVTQYILKKNGKGKGIPFPKRPKKKNDNGNSIAAYLGIKLVNQGSVAIFCGKKVTVAGICAEIVDAYARELPLSKPLDVSNGEEITKLAALYCTNLGADASTSRAAALGVLSHNGNTPHGIRLAVEYAMKEGDAKFIICTSTLAQGVNLPIKYLIVSSVYQGREQIKVRDFHNLIGRAGRAGMHVEGTILFADPRIYDGRIRKEDKWRWPQAQQLLNQENSEPVVSSIQRLFEPFKSDNGRSVLTLDLIEIARWYTKDKLELQEALWASAKEHAAATFTVKGLADQARWKFKIFAAIESYLMAHWEETGGDGFSQTLAEGTLAYALVSDGQKKQLVELFGILAEHVRSTVPDADRRVVFARTLQGVTTNIELEKWVTEYFETLKQVTSHEDLLQSLWSIISGGIENGTFQKIDKPEAMVEAALWWIAGASFGTIFNQLNQKDVKITWGTKRRELTVEHIVDICEGAFGYDGALRIGAIADLLASQDSDDDERQALVERLGELHKRFKYGLPQTSAVALYECGFSDRVVAQNLSNIIGNASITQSEAISMLTEQRAAASDALREYPRYFQICLTGLIS